ncbi:hypothetical protein ACFWIA_12705 [Streptomyces sp. NPDC127068]|uniref:hypothetical protein n=1 Tax=Streptomyces sp. NPDC127068 TaxID=3347127 RepID=UPI00364FF4D2
MSISSDSRTTRSTNAQGLRRSLLRRQETGEHNPVLLIAVVGALTALLCAVVYLGSMTYTLVHYRFWDGLSAWAAFTVSLIFALLALLSTLPLAVTQNEMRSPVVARYFLWGTCLILAGVQFAASVLGQVSLPLSGVVGMTTVMGIACSAELAAHGVAEFRSGGSWDTA